MKSAFTEAWLKKAADIEGDANVAAGVPPPEPDDGPRLCYRVGRVLIPGCWGTVRTGDMRDCRCDRPTADDRLTKLEKQMEELLKRLPGTKEAKP